MNIEDWLVLVIFVQTVFHWKERRDLYNRIMSKNLGEYMAVNDKAQVKIRKSDIQKI